MHVEALDQLLRLGARLRGIAAGVGGLQLDRPAGEHVVALLEEGDMPCSICSPPEASGPDLMVRKADLDRPSLRDAAGTLSADVATPLASAPCRTVRRLSFIGSSGWFLVDASW
jgi:hypothetical protein